MNFPQDLKYTKEHEWVRVEGDSATMGITEFAQSELGEVVFADLPAQGKFVEQGKTICVVESTKAASDVYSPLSGTITEVNNALKDAPDLINKSPYDQGWLVRLTAVKAVELEKLMSASEYRNFLGDRAG